MLASLSVRDVVAVRSAKLRLDGPGLVALTGETGAGKSVLLAALALALGARAAARLVRPGAAKAQVTAAFTPGREHPVWGVLAEAGIAADPSEPLLFRRTLTADGRSAGFVNDQSATARLMATAASTLVEVHGQFAAQELLTPATHRTLLDAYAGHAHDLPALWGAWRATREALEALEAGAAQARAAEEALRTDLEYLEGLAPEPGEGRTLEDQRTRLMHKERTAQALAAALAALEEDSDGPDPVSGALGSLARAGDTLGAGGQAAIEGLIRAQAEVEGALCLVRDMAEGLEEAGDLETVDDRLHALRTAARRLGCDAHDLSDRLEALRAQVVGLEDGRASLEGARAHADAARADYIAGAQALSSARADAARRLEAAVAEELAPLKLSKVRFSVALEDLPEERWGPEGVEAARFLVATTPGAAPGPLDKVASGGEAARLMLALRAVLAGCGPAKTLVFDEVDASIGGAVAAAVGARLTALARRHQVVTITHAPQVAARAAAHLRVSKGPGGATALEPLEARVDRAEEIARMLAGAEVTDEARAAAEKLLDEA